jgi:hypothetical protein
VYLLRPPSSGQAEAAWSEAINILYPPGPKRFLDQLSVFVPNRIFGQKRRPADSVETNFDLWAKAILRSPDKFTLESGKLRVGLKGRNGFGLDLRSIRRSIRDVQAGYARQFLHFRKTGVSDLTPDSWSEMILKDLGEPVTAPNVALVLDRLDAAYRFCRYLWQFIRNSDYDFAKHGTEIVDAQQLYYLCEPNLYFVTNDGRIKKAVFGSAQAQRILTYKELTEFA